MPKNKDKPPDDERKLSERCLDPLSDVKDNGLSSRQNKPTSRKRRSVLPEPTVNEKDMGTYRQAERQNHTNEDERCLRCGMYGKKTKFIPEANIRLCDKCEVEDLKERELCGGCDECYDY